MPALQRRSVNGSLYFCGLAGEADAEQQRKTFMNDAQNTSKRCQWLIKSVSAYEAVGGDGPGGRGEGLPAGSL